MNLSQAEIDAMLSGGSLEAREPAGMGGELTAVEIDTLGEVGNMCMGAMATTMYTLLDRRVEITTPRVEVHTTKDVLSMYQVPFVIVEVEYTKGIRGKNLLLLKEYDAALITDVLMGGEGVIEEPTELSELHMSAINEIMNQMIGASATALSQVIGDAVDISPPTSELMVLQSENGGMLGTDDLVIVINFDMKIEGLLRSQLVQLMPYAQGRELSAKLTSANEAAAEPAAKPKPEPEQPAAPKPQPVGPSLPSVPEEVTRPAEPVTSVNMPQYESFAPPSYSYSAAQDSMNLVYDIPVQVSVELGKTKKEISEILDFDTGTVVVLDKIAGDPVEILVNGKLVASGEVVVIDENYGVRITHLHG